MKFFSYLCLLWPLAGMAADEPGFHKLIYEAEVYGKTEESLSKLNQLLAQAPDETRRMAIIRAMSIIKKSVGPVFQPPGDQSLQNLLFETRAIIIHPPFAYLHNQGSWLGLGDWIGDFRIVDMSFTHITLEDATEMRQVLQVPQISGDAMVEGASGSLLLEASVGEVLAFATRKEKLNFFLPSAINDRINGFFPDTDWQSLIDQVCARSGIIWTRRHGSIMYEQANIQSTENAMIRGIETKNRLLGSVLQEIADIVGLELIIFDETLREVGIDLYLADQPWNEALDCLSISTGFNWALAQQGSGLGQLVVTRE